MCIMSRRFVWTSTNENIWPESHFQWFLSKVTHQRFLIAFTLRRLRNVNTSTSFVWMGRVVLSGCCLHNSTYRKHQLAAMHSTSCLIIRYFHFISATKRPNDLFSMSPVFHLPNIIASNAQICRIQRRVFSWKQSHWVDQAVRNHRPSMHPVQMIARAVAVWFRCVVCLMIEPPSNFTEPNNSFRSKSFQDRFYLSAVEKRWHAGCLQCCVCQQRLEGETSCFSRDGNIYCKNDYYRWVPPRSKISTWKSISLVEILCYALVHCETFTDRPTTIKETGCHQAKHPIDLITSNGLM